MQDWTRLETAHGPVRAWRHEPDDGTRTGVVLVQEIFGVNAHIRDVAGRLAAAGHTVLAPSVYDPVEPAIELDYDEAGVARGRALAAALGFERAVDIVEAAADRMHAEGLAVAVLGFCWGGTVAFLASTRLALPAVSYYGGRTVPFLDERPRAPLLLHFGERDPIIPPPDVELHRQKLPDARIHVHPAGHGFNCDRRADHDAAAAETAWATTLDFLQQVTA